MHQQPTLRAWLTRTYLPAIRQAVAESIEANGEGAGVEVIVAESAVDLISLGAGRHYDEAPWVRTMTADPGDYSGVRRGIYPGQNYIHRYAVYRLEIASGVEMVSVGADGGQYLDPMFVYLEDGHIVIRAADDNHRDNQISWVDDHIRRANEVIEIWNRTHLSDTVTSEFARQTRLRTAEEQRTASVTAAGFTRTSTTIVPLRLPLPDTRWRASRGKPQRSQSDEGVAYTLEPDQFEDILDCIATHRDQVERLPGAGAPIEAPEDDHRDQLLNALNVRFRDATGETFSKGGKTDIRVFVHDHSYFHAECKIWKGVSSLDKAMEQLVDKYLTYRDRHGALVMFVRDIEKPGELPAKAIEHLVANYSGERLSDVSTFPQVRTRVSNGRSIDLAIVMIVLDSAPPRSALPSSLLRG